MAVFRALRYVLIAGFFIFTMSLSFQLKAKNNRFLETSDISATYVSNGWADWSTSDISISFYLRNVSNSGISVFVDGGTAYVADGQNDDFQITHIHAVACQDTKFGALPVLFRSQKREAMRKAVYIPQGDGLYVTIKMRCDNVVKKNHMMRGGVFSGRVTVIQERRFLVRNISGRF